MAVTAWITQIKVKFSESFNKIKDKKGTCKNTSAQLAAKITLKLLVLYFLFHQIAMRI